MSRSHSSPSALFLGVLTSTLLAIAPGANAAEHGPEDEGPSHEPGDKTEHEGGGPESFGKERATSLGLRMSMVTTSQPGVGSSVSVGPEFFFEQIVVPHWLALEVVVTALYHADRDGWSVPVGALVKKPFTLGPIEGYLGIGPTVNIEIEEEGVEVRPGVFGAMDVDLWLTRSFGFTLGAVTAMIFSEHVAFEAEALAGVTLRF